MFDYNTGSCFGVSDASDLRRTTTKPLIKRLELPFKNNQIIPYFIRQNDKFFHVITKDKYLMNRKHPARVIYNLGNFKNIDTKIEALERLLDSYSRN